MGERFIPIGHHCDRQPHYGKIYLVSSTIERINHTTRTIFLTVQGRDGVLVILDDRVAKHERFMLARRNHVVISSAVPQKSRRFPPNCTLPIKYIGRSHDVLVSSTEHVAIIKRFEII